MPLVTFVIIVAVLGLLLVYTYMNRVEVAGWLYLNTAIRSVSLTDGEIMQYRPDTPNSVIVKGRLGLLAKSVESVVAAADRTHIRPSSWIVFDPKPQRASFTGKISLVRGWNYVLFRSVGHGFRFADPINVGCGEVFIVAGQSNAAGSDPTLYMNGNRSCRQGRLTPGGRLGWKDGSDPQIKGGQGSVWPFVGQQLQERLQVPIGFINVAVGSTSIVKWQPGTENFRRLKRALTAFGRAGVRAMLWQQGEQDRQMKEEEYYTLLKNVIVELRGCSSGSRIEWVVATTSYVQGRIGEGTRNAQRRICIEGLAHSGPDTDMIDQHGRDDSNIHIAGQGTATLADMWTKCLFAAFFPEYLDS